MRRSKHSLSHYHLTTCDMGQIVPVGVVPVLPGDTIGHQTNLLIRVSPMAAPVMHQVDARIHHFFVANRTIWNGAKTGDTDSWEDFITGGEDGMDTAIVPKITSTATPKTLLDHMGVPNIAGVDINALPLRAVNFIVNEFYRDQDLGTARALTDLTVPLCAWEKDYYTTARPWSAKGPQVSIPLGDSAPVHVPETERIEVFNDATGSNKGIRADAADAYKVDAADTTQSTNQMYVDLSQATGADPIDVRTAWGMQRFMENAARFGSRYPEKMRQLGSRYRGLMDRPEFLGGGSQSINFSEVIQTANDTGDRAFGVGDLYGHGIAATRSNKYARRIDEHGYVISLLSVRPKSIYENGVHREWLRTDREDFHDPYLEFIGQQEVWNGELDLGHTSGHKGAFGYSDKYQEYRGHPSYVSGEFRNTLDYWHLARDLTDPVLNESFVSCNPSKRIFNEQVSDSLWVMSHHKIAAHRNITRDATPRLI